MKKKPKGRKQQTDSKATPLALEKASTPSQTVSPLKWIRIDRHFPVPNYVKSALQRLDDAGHVAYLVGGCVRDFLLGRETKDHDLATSASPDQLCVLFPEAIPVGKAFGVIRLPIKTSEQPGAENPNTKTIEIATFRQDLEYRDHRRPTGILFAGPEEDARRRDFTVNGLFFDPKTSRILDSVGGFEDLQKKIIRAIGVPSQRFREDALRLLRAVRFTTTLEFKLDEETAKAIQHRAKLIQKVSVERICEELTQMWTGPHPDQALKLLSELDLLPLILPELEKMKGVEQSPSFHPEGDVWKHTIKIMNQLSAQNRVRSATLAWGALLHDIGKPIAAVRSGGKNFNGHEVDGSRMALAIGERLKMSRSDIQMIQFLIEDHLKFKDVFQMRESTLQRWIRKPYFEELLALHRADSMASDGNLSFYEFCMSTFEEWKRASLEKEELKLVTGKDLIHLGLSPGPQFAEILKTIEDLAFEKKLHSKEEALEYVVKHFVH